MLIEMLPLRPPSEGWELNWVYWLRTTLSILLISLGAAIQVTLMIPAAGMTLKQILCMVIGASTAYIVQTLVLAQIWRFPVQFSLTIGNPVWEATMYLCARFAIGQKKWRENPEIAKQVKSAVPLVIASSFLILIYPVYEAIFLQLHGLAQAAFVLLLPVIKYFMNKLIERIATADPAANVIGMTSVRLFDALYMFKCMGSAGTLIRV